MKENLIVSDKGQITLPAAMRRSLGIGRKSVVTAEQIEGRIVLTPAVVVETEMYTDRDIAAWNRADAFAPGERKRLTGKLSRRRG